MPDGDDRCAAIDGMRIYRRIPKYCKKTCPNAILSTTNPAWPDLGSNPGHRCDKPSNNRLSNGMTLMLLSCIELEGAPWRPITSTSTSKDRLGSHYQTTLCPVERSAPGIETVVVPREGAGTRRRTGTARAGCERGGAGSRLGCCRNVTTSTDQEPGMSRLVYREPANLKSRVNMVK
jgi:hypothetical protein